MSTSTTTTAIVVLCVFVSSVVYCNGQVQVSITLPNGNQVNEADSSIQVCVQTNAPLSSPASVQFVTQSQIAQAGMDFLDASRTISFNSSPNRESSCFNISIIQDKIVESNMETFLIFLTMPTGGITADIQVHTVTIMDTDSLLISFTQSSYTVAEGTSSVSVCSEIVNGSLADNSDEVRFGIDALNSGTAIRGVDFIANLGDLQFIFDGPDETMSCVSIDIIDDNTIEDTEQFLLSLELIPGLSESVEFVNSQTSVVIEDNDAASVALSPNQGIALVEGNRGTRSLQLVCVMLMDNNNNEIDRDVVVNVATLEDTATEGDFELLSTMLIIPKGSGDGDTKCFNVTIIGDNFLEENETFTVELTTITQDMVIDGYGSITITILHDGDVNICPELEAPKNGTLDSSGYDLGSIAIYICDDNFQLSIVPSTRTCQEGGTWSGDNPRCIAVCGILSISNGQVTTDGYLEGSTAFYSCRTGYSLVGNDMRACQNNTQWSGEDPTCEVIDCDVLPPIPSGRVIYESGSTLFKARATYICNIGFTITAGNAIRVCEQDGQWTGTPAVCTRGSSSGSPVMSSGVLFVLLIVATVITSLFG